MSPYIGPCIGSLQVAPLPRLRQNHRIQKFCSKWLFGGFQLKETKPIHRCWFAFNLCQNKVYKISCFFYVHSKPNYFSGTSFDQERVIGLLLSGNSACPRCLPHAFLQGKDRCAPLLEHIGLISLRMQCAVCGV